MALLPLLRPPRLREPFRGNPGPQPREVLCSPLQVCARSLGGVEPRVRSEGAGQEILWPRLEGHKAPVPSLSSEMWNMLLCFPCGPSPDPSVNRLWSSSPLDELGEKSEA